MKYKSCSINIFIENVEQRVLTQQIGNQLTSILKWNDLENISRNTELNKVSVDEINYRIEEMNVKG